MPLLGELDRACGDAAKKDAGFSPLMLQWLLRDFPVDRLAEREGLPRPDVERLRRFRDERLERLAKATPPDA